MANKEEISKPTGFTSLEEYMNHHRLTEYEVPGDGHCIAHAIAKAIGKTTEEVIKRMLEECKNNHQRYEEYVTGDPMEKNEILTQEMKQWAESKIYNQKSDLLFNMAANTFHRDIKIAQTEGDVIVTTISCEQSSSSPIQLVKREMHYNALKQQVSPDKPPSRCQYCYRYTNFREYTYEKQKYFICTKCWREWPRNDELSYPITSRYSPHGKKINKNQLLQAGNHIMWRRPYVLRHHAIVCKKSSGKSEQNGTTEQSEPINTTEQSGSSQQNNTTEQSGTEQSGQNVTEPSGPSQQNNTSEQNDTTDKITVMHWAKEKLCSCKCTIHKSEEEIEQCCSVTYKATEWPDRWSLIEARMTALEGFDKYSFFHKNCENFAWFCTTGVSFNQQYPWLIIKVDGTATASILGAVKSMKLFPILNLVEHAKVDKLHWNWPVEVLGSIVVLLVETVSLFTDLGHLYLDKKVLEEETCNEIVCTRVTEFVFGLLGIIGGNMLFEWLSLYIGDKICPGLGSLVAFALGTSLFGVIGGTILGLVLKWFGNIIAIGVSCCISRCINGCCSSGCCNGGCCSGRCCSSRCCSSGCSASGCRAGECCSNSDRGEENGTNDRYVYKSSSWRAQVGLVLVWWSVLLLVAFSSQYVATYAPVRGSIPATCDPQKTINISSTCVTIEVRVRDCLGNAQSCNITKTDQSSVQYFEDEITLQLNDCTYRPWCTNDPDAVKNYVARYANCSFDCYYTVGNKSVVIRKLTDTATFWHMFMWPILGALVGFYLIVKAYWIRKEKYDLDALGENCVETIIIILGIWLVYDFIKTICAIIKLTSETTNEGNNEGTTQDRSGSGQSPKVKYSKHGETSANSDSSTGNDDVTLLVD